VNLPRSIELDLSGAASLLNDDTHAILATAVSAWGAELLEHRPFQTSYRPNRRFIVHYICRVDLAGAQATWTLVAMVAPTLPQDATIIEGGDTRVAIWRLPHDPFLPGLVPAVDETAVRGLLDRFGVAPGDRSIAMRSYRACRRAVVEARVGGQRIFLKVVRPSTAERLHELHTAFSESVPVPPTFGWSHDGIVALGALPGRTLAAQLEDENSPLPDPAHVVELCDIVGGVRLAAPRLVTIDKAVAHHVRVLTALIPEYEQRLSRLAEVAGTLAVHPTRTVHGDLHPGQLLTDERVVGLLDVDRAGLGSVEDDYAMLLGHLRVHASLIDRHLQGRALAFVERLRAAFLERSDTRDLTVREAVVVLGLATAPFRMLHPAWEAMTVERVGLAESILGHVAPH